MASPIVLPPLKERPTPNRSSRHGGRVSLIVVHDTEGGYEGSIEWLCNPAAQASAHIVLREDGGEATQLVPWDEKAWSCVAFNSVSENLELAGFAARWYGLRELQVAARIVAFRLRKRGLPARWATGGRGLGFCRHADLGVAGGGHHDPTTSIAKWLLFVAMVKHEYARGGFRRVWGVEEVPSAS